MCQHPLRFDLPHHKGKPLCSFPPLSSTRMTMTRKALAITALVLAISPAATTSPPDERSNSTGEAVIKNCSTICIPFLGNAFVYCVANAREQPHLRQVVWTDPQGRDVLPWAPERQVFILGNTSFLSHSYLIFQDFNTTIAGTYWCSVLVNGSEAGRDSIRILVSGSNEASSTPCQCELSAASWSVRAAEEKCWIDSSTPRGSDKLIEEVCQQGRSSGVPEDECLFPSAVSARIPRTFGSWRQEILAANGTRLSSPGRLPGRRDQD
ncbi:uncharacterized protein LOC122248948 [Penaeus japonicus]|uniref:uncharacterized protein LOC122248948 n=1 Tax=Penaeus japonicus TaxID=27405 RepID=UPI001C7179A7|nr:uncharacterized protein LOC122248948 [Penaeus japonicus]